MTNNNNNNKAQIAKINNYRYTAIKPFKNKFVKLDKLLKCFSHIELKEYILHNILTNKIGIIQIETLFYQNIMFLVLCLLNNKYL